MRKQTNLYFSDRTEKPKKRMSPQALRGLLILCGVALVCLTAAVLTGLFLGRAAERVPTETETGSRTAPPDPADVPEVGAKSLSAQSALSAELTPGDTVSVTVRDAQGRIFIRSALLSSLGLSSDADAPDAGTLVGAVHERQARVSLCLYLFAPSAQDDTLRERLYGIEETLLTEICDAGPDEILLFGCPMDADGIVRMRKLLTDLRTRFSGTAFCVCVPYRFLTESESAPYTDYLGYVDFLGLDLHGTNGPEGTLTEQQDGSFLLVPNPDNLTNVYRTCYTTIVSHRMRLLPDAEGGELPVPLREAGCRDWQLNDIYPQE